MKRDSFTGNVMVEYVLPIALVGLACLYGLTFLGDASNSFLNGMSKKMDDSKTVKLAATDTTAGSGGTDSNSSNTSRSSTGQDLSDASLLLLPSDTSRSIDTMGANGTTDQLAMQLTTFAQQSLSKGDITQEQANQLQDLANQGYRLGRIEAAVESAFANNQSTVEFEGKTYSLYELAHTLNAYAEDDRTTLTPTNNRSSLDDGNVGSELHNFMVTYNEARNSGALSNTEVKSTVTGLSTQISTISDSMAESIFRLTQTNEKSNVAQINNSTERGEFLQGMTGGLFSSVFNLPKNTKSSTATTGASAGICASGSLNYGQSKKNGCI